jgi:hypothetical protein
MSPNRTRGLEAKDRIRSGICQLQSGQFGASKLEDGYTLAHDALYDFGVHRSVSMVRETALMSVSCDSSASAAETLPIFLTIC